MRGRLLAILTALALLPGAGAQAQGACLTPKAAFEALNASPPPVSVQDHYTGTAAVQIAGVLGAVQSVDEVVVYLVEGNGRVVVMTFEHGCSVAWVGMTAARLREMINNELGAPS